MEQLFGVAKSGIFAAMRGVSPQTTNPPPARPDARAVATAPADISMVMANNGVAVPPKALVWRRSAGAERPTAELLAHFRNKDVELAAIRDPYALASGRARWAHIEFLAALNRNCRYLSAAMIEYAPDSKSSDGESLQRRNVGVLFSRAFPDGGPNLALKRRQSHSPGADDDFNERSIQLYVRRQGALKKHEIMFGQSIEALFDVKKQCTVTYTPPLEERGWVRKNEARV